MSRALKNVLPVVFLLVFIFIFRTQIVQAKTVLLNKLFPCSQPITYSIGTFDTKFGVSKSDFLQYIAQAEAVWEKPIGKNLFEYSDNGVMKVNLVYDSRQATTEQLKQMGIVVDNTRANYDSIKAKYNAFISEYNTAKANLDSVVENFETRRAKYEQEVSAVNRKGGADKATYTQLNAEKDYLNSQIKIINELQDNLNKTADSINTLAVTLNQIAVALNLNVKAYNTTGASLGGEFEEGTYTTGPDGQQIDIYQFDNKAKLVRVIAHELGHALGLDHNDDSKAIMYRLNNGLNDKPTNTDLEALKKLCRIK